MLKLTRIMAVLKRTEPVIKTSELSYSLYGSDRVSTSRGVFMKTESSRASEVLKSTRIMATLKRTEPLIKQKGIIVYPAAVRRSVAIVELHRQSGKFRIRRLERPCPCMSDGFLVLRQLPSRLFSSPGKVQPHRYSCVVSL